MKVFREVNLDLGSLKRATNEFEVEHWFATLFDQLGLEYEAQYRIVKGRPDCLIGDVIIDYKHGISENELKKWLHSKGLQYIQEYFSTRGRYPSLLIVITEEDIYYHDKDLQLQSKRKISEKTLLSLIESLLGPKVLDSEQFATLFGVDSPLYILAYSRLERHFDERAGERTACFQQWKKHFSLAYHDKKIGKELFLRHSYLSMLIKLILYRDFIKPHEYSRDSFKQLENYFELLGISLFHHDFFRWVINVEGLCDDFFNKLKLVKFEATDIFRTIYQEMIIAGVRHRLGEFYTPEQLCRKMIEKEYKIGMRVLDSSCGSGTFLIEILKKVDAHFSLKEDVEPPDEWFKAVNNIFGFDINPIAILTSKANLLLYLKKRRSWIEKISINIFLCNSIDPLKFAPTQDIQLGKFYSFCIDLLGEEKELRIPQEALNSENIEFFQALIRAIYNVWEDFNQFQDSLEAALERIPEGKLHSFLQQNAKLMDFLQNFFHQLFELKAQDKDHIWLYILNNLVGIRSLLLQKKMDLIITNPPWLTYKDADDKLRADMKRISEEFNIKPSAENITNIEEAVVFLYKIPHLYLRRDGKGRVAFVMPRSLLVSSQNQHARRFDYFRDIEFFEFNDLVFNIDCCCFFGTHVTDVSNRKEVFTKYPAKCSYFDASTMNLLEEHELEPYVYFEAKKGEKYLVKKLIRKEKKEKLLPCCLSEYYNDFIQGADLIPKSLLHVNILSKTNEGKIAIIDPWISPQAKGFWKNKHFSRARIESENLFKATLSRGLYPYYIELRDIFLPLNSKLEYKPETLGPYSRNHWRNIKAIYEKETGSDLFEVGINYRNKLCKENKVKEEQRKPYKVIFPNAKSLMAAVIKDQNSRIYVDSTLYYFGTKNEEEAYYLCGMLNISKLKKSTKIISDTRHHHKRPLYFNIPKYNGSKKQVEIARLAKKCSDIVGRFIKSGEKRKSAVIQELIRDDHRKIHEIGINILKSAEGTQIIKEYLLD
ncbi:MAG: N-6 DNA methylase [Promethearchaeota archaeon]